MNQSPNENDGATRPATAGEGETVDGFPASASATTPQPDPAGDATLIDANGLVEFGRYRIERLLGRGAMGEVYLAHDTQLDRRVALKIPLVVPGAPPTMLERFLREARAAAQVHHPNICPIFDVGEFEGRRFISMAYVEGRPLSDYVASGTRFPVKHVVRVVRKIALALAEAHDKGLLHRDVKPSNVMIDHRNEPIVMDFGLARSTDESESRLTREGTIIGTPAYMAPEQLDGTGRLGPAVDVHALGVLLYEFLTGRLPYQGDFHAMAVRILHDEPVPVEELRPDVPPALAEVCRRALAKDPDDRFETMRDFAKSLAASAKGKGAQRTVTAPSATKEMTYFERPFEELDDLPQPPTEEVAPPRVRRASRRRPSNKRSWPVGALVGGGVFALVCVVTGWIVVQAIKRQPNDEETSGRLADTDGADASEKSNPADRGEGSVAGAEGDDQREPHQPGDDAPERLPDPGETVEPARFFELRDRNRDGFLDRGELPPHIVHRADRNDDDLLTLEELRTGLAEKGPRLLGPPGPAEGPPPRDGRRPPRPRDR